MMDNSLPSQVERYERDYMHLPDDRLDHGDEWTSAWGWRTQFINLRIRIDRLSRLLAIRGVPTVLLKQELDLIDERLRVIREIIDQEVSP